MEETHNKIVFKCTDEMKNKINVIIRGKENLLQIEENVEITDMLTIYIADNNNTVSIGKGTTFEETSIAIADCNNYVKIGEDCMFARNTNILASDFHSIIDLESGKRKNLSKGVCIENHVWVGYGAIILKNSYIYANSIIGAGALIHGTISANSIYPRVGGGEVTWARCRDVLMKPLQNVFLHQRKKWDSIENKHNIIFQIENDITMCFNKIKGWAFVEDMDSRNAKIYLYCKMSYRKTIKASLISLFILERADVVNFFNNEKYLYCGFDSYLPAYMIQEREKIESIDLVINIDAFWGKQRLYEKNMRFK